jgi:hypothetical protein
MEWKEFFSWLPLGALILSLGAHPLGEEPPHVEGRTNSENQTTVGLLSASKNLVFTQSGVLNNKFPN